jgi:hypothetical protein
MSIALHWYLPTHGDGRTLLQAGAATQSRGVYQRGDSAGTGRAAPRRSTTSPRWLARLSNRASMPP